MTSLDVTTARSDFAETVNRVSYGRERIAIRRHGKILAALVSADDLALLQQITDARDYKEAQKALAKFRKAGRKAIPWKEAKKELGL